MRFLNKFYIFFAVLLTFPILAEAATSTYNYSINLMWINKAKAPKERLVFPDKYEKVDIQNDIRSWAEKNPQAPINVWIDSKNTSPEQVENTKNVFEAWNLDMKRDAPNIISLRDISEIPLVKNEPEIFSNKIPLYFRTDLIDIALTLYLLQKCSDPNCIIVYTDLSVEPMGPDKLFDQKTMEKLGKYGAVFTNALGGGAFGLEDIFHIVSNKKPNLIKALQTMIVELNIARAKNALNNQLETHQKPQTKALEEIIYNSFRRMFEYFYHLEGLGKITKGNKLYDPEKNGLEPFGPKSGSSSYQAGWEFEPIDKSIWDKKNNTIKVPGKAVKSSRMRGSVTIDV